MKSLRINQLNTHINDANIESFEHSPVLFIHGSIIDAVPRIFQQPSKKEKQKSLGELEMKLWKLDALQVHRDQSVCECIIFRSAQKVNGFHKLVAIWIRLGKLRWFVHKIRSLLDDNRHGHVHADGVEKRILWGFMERFLIQRKSCSQEFHVWKIKDFFQPKSCNNYVADVFRKLEVVSATNNKTSPDIFLAEQISEEVIVIVRHKELIWRGTDHQLRHREVIQVDCNTICSGGSIQQRW